MKISFLIALASIYCLGSCRQRDDAVVDMGDDPAISRSDPSRYVTEVQLLSPDQHGGYDNPCKLLDEGYVQITFGIDKPAELTTTQVPAGCVFRWPQGVVMVGFGSSRPFASLDYAEDSFDRLYRPDQSNRTTMVPVRGVGDKAVWEPSRNTLHVLFTNNILNVRVQAKGRPSERQQMAAELVGVVMTRFHTLDEG